MSSNRNEIKSAIRLPSVLAIGFTGHRKLPNEAVSRRLICDFLEQEKAATPDIVYGVSSVAAGADLLFAESCLELDVPLRVLLPLSIEEFRKDFDEETWSRVEQVLSKAVSVEIIANSELRNEGYYECGIETVQQSEMLVALWDGEPSRGMGGTQEIVSFAEKMGRPVVWFHSATGTRNVLNEPALQHLEQLRDPELDFLNGLPDLGATLSSNSSEDLVKAWLDKIDKNASRFAPQVRRLSSIPIVCTAAAAFFSGGGLKVPHAEFWLAFGTGLGVTAALLPFALRLNRRQALWARTRTAAEVCRSRLALWGAPNFEEVIGPEIVPELAGILMTLKLLKAFDASRKPRSIDSFKYHYKKERVLDQMDYFARNSLRSANEARKYRIAIGVFIGLAILIAATLWVKGLALGNAQLFPGERWLAVAIPALFQLATVAAALLVVHDCERRQRRYRELHDWLEEWDVELGVLKTWPTLLKVAGRIERALLVELLEWKSLVKNIKLPRK
jgi:hypothetical protein